jgi:Anti-sigma factor NepR
MNLDQDQLKAERRRLSAAFDGVLDEPVPDRLTALLAEPAPQVVDLGAVRAQRRGMSSWAAWGGMAATLVLGTLIGTRLTPPGMDEAGRLVVTGDIDKALNSHLASDSPDAVNVQLSFKAKDGRYCRTFSTDSSAGLACRQPDGAWVLKHLAALPASGSEMRQASSSLPLSVLAAVDETIAGEALNAEQERAARDTGWQR